MVVNSSHVDHEETEATHRSVSADVDLDLDLTDITHWERVAAGFCLLTSLLTVLCIAILGFWKLLELIGVL